MQWEHLVIGWLYAWGIVVTATYLSLARCIEERELPPIVGPVLLAAVWPLSVPYLTAIVLKRTRS